MAADWPADDGDFAARLAEYADGSANERKLLFDYGPLIFPRLVTIACSDRPGLRAAGLDALGRLIKLVGLGRMLVRALCSEAGLNNPSLEVQKECALAIGRVMQACSSLPDEDRDNIGWIRVLPHLVRLCAQPETTVGAEQALLHLRSLLGPRSFHRRFTRALLAYHENLMERTINIGNTSLVDLERKGDDVAEGLGQDLVGPSLSWTLWHLVKEGPLDTSVDGLRALAAAIEPHPKSSRDILLTLLPMIESFDIEVSEAALTAAAAHFHHDTCFDIVSSHPMVSVITKRERSREGPRTTRKTTVVPGPSHPASAPQTTAQRSSASISTAQPASFAPASARVASPASAYLRKPSLDLSELESAHNSNPETASLPSRTALASSSSSSPSPSPAPASVFSNAGNSMMKMTAQLSTLKRKTSGRKRLGSAASSDDLRPQSAGRSRMSARSSPLSASSARSVSSENGRPPPTMGAPRHELAVAAARGALHSTAVATTAAIAAASANYVETASSMNRDASRIRTRGAYDALDAEVEEHQHPEQSPMRRGHDSFACREGTIEHLSSTLHHRELLSEPSESSQERVARSLSATHPNNAGPSRRATISRQRSAPLQGHGKQGQDKGHNRRTADVMHSSHNMTSSRSERAASSNASSGTSHEGLNEYEPPPKLSARESLPATSDGIVKLLLDDSQWQDQVRVLNAIKSNQHTGVLPPNCRSDAAVIQAVIKLTSSLRSSLSKSSLLCLHFLISDNGRGFWREQSPALVDAIVGALIKRSIDASTFLAQEARSALDACVQSFPANKFCLSLLQHCHAHPNARARANAANALHSIVQTSPPSAYDAGRVVSCAKDKLLHDNSVEARAAAKGILMQLNETQNLDRKQQLHLERIGASPLARKQPTHAARTSRARQQPVQTNQIPPHGHGQPPARTFSATSLDLHADLVSGLRARDWQARLHAARGLQAALTNEMHPGLFQLACESVRDANVKVRGEAVRAIHAVATRYGPGVPAAQLSTLLLPVAAAAGDRATQPLALACLRVYLKASPDLSKSLRRHLASLPPKAKASIRPLLPAF